MEGVLGVEALNFDLERLDSSDTVLHINLDGRDPDEGMTQVAYEKGALFLRQLEELVGRTEFDRFLRGYFNHFSFQSITTADFEAYLRENLLVTDASSSRVAVDEWLRGVGIPEGASRPSSDAFTLVEEQVAYWVGGDNLRKGAALNILQMVEWMLDEGCL